MDVPISTLSGWLKDVNLTTQQQEKLRMDWKKGLIKARGKAVLWHNKQKNMRLIKATKEAERILNNIKISDKYILEIALSFLYLGEGAKQETLTIANSNPNILLFYLSAMEKIYKINRNDLIYHLHLRADQKESRTKKFWSETLHIPVEKITYCVFDQRTVGRETYDTYHGVCVINGGGIQIQRRILEISRIYSSMIVNSGAVSSSGRACR